MAKETYMGIPLTKKIDGKTFGFHSRYAEKRYAEREAAFLRQCVFTDVSPKKGKSRWLVRVVPIDKAGAKYAIYTRAIS